MFSCFYTMTQVHLHQCKRTFQEVFVFIKESYLYLIEFQFFLEVQNFILIKREVNGFQFLNNNSNACAIFLMYVYMEDWADQCKVAYLFCCFSNKCARASTVCSRHINVKTWGISLYCLSMFLTNICFVEWFLFY